jgi:hypothetical protein
MKKFSPEIFYLIFNYFRNNISSLHSLLLVNRGIAVQLLYEKALLFNNTTQNQRKRDRIKFDNSLFNIIINYLTNNSKKFLLENTFQPISFENLTFNYLDYCKEVSIDETINLIRGINPENVLEEEVIKLLVKKSKIRKIMISENFNSCIIGSFTENLEIISLQISDKVIANDSIKLIHSQKRLLNLKLLFHEDLWNEVIPKLSKISTLQKNAQHFRIYSRFICIY